MTLRDNPKLHAFHQAQDAMLWAVLSGDQTGVVHHQERLDNLALALKDDRYIQGLHRQAAEITDSPNPRAHAIGLIEDDARRLRLPNVDREVESDR